MINAQQEFKFPYFTTTITREMLDPVRNNKTIKHITIPDSITEIEEYTFAGCDGLISIDIPNSVTYIGESAFAGCTGLTSITIPKKVDDIEKCAFHNCEGLTSIIILSSFTKIKENVFRGCNGLLFFIIPEAFTIDNYQLARQGIDLNKIKLVTLADWSMINTPIQGIDLDKIKLDIQPDWVMENTLPSTYSCHDIFILFKLQKENSYTPSWALISKIVPNVVMSDLLKILPAEKKCTVLPKTYENLSENEGLLRLSLFSFVPVVKTEVQQANHNHEKEVVNEYIRSNEPEKTLYLKDMSGDDSMTVLQWLTIKEVAILLKAKATSDLKPIMKDEMAAVSESTQKISI